MKETERVEYLVVHYSKLQLARDYEKLEQEIERLEKENEKLKIENNLLKQLVCNDKQYTTGIR